MTRRSPAPAAAMLLAFAAAGGCAATPPPASADPGCTGASLGFDRNTRLLAMTLTMRNTGLECRVNLAAFPTSAPAQRDPTSGTALVRPPRHGTATAEPGRVTYLPAPGFVGADEVEARTVAMGVEIGVLVRVTVLPP